MKEMSLGTQQSFGEIVNNRPHYSTAKETLHKVRDEASRNDGERFKNLSTITD